MKMKLHRLLPALWLTFAVPAVAIGEREVVLGAENTIYELRQGVYGELFPGGTAAAEASGVLALEAVRYLVENAGDEAVGAALTDHVFYVFPRLNPDGAEAMFAGVKRDAFSFKSQLRA